MYREGRARRAGGQARNALLFAARTVGPGIRARREYRTDFAAAIAAGILYQSTGLLLAVVAFGALPGFGPWSLSDILLMVGLRLAGHALYAVVFANLPRLPLIIVQGRLDRMMMRPVPVLIQVICDEVNVNALGDLAIAALFWCFAVPGMQVHWDAGRVLFCGAAAISGMLIEAALQITVSALCIRSIGFESVYYWVDSTVMTFAGYPLGLFHTLGSWMFTFVMPIGFIAYFPAAHLTGKESVALFAPWMAVLAPLSGPLAISAALLLWRRSLRSYEGGGSTA
ncbi:ABC transporter permease [Kitasatospora sp. NBC_00315]|uniref:ABC transporter permease n=1 Tax=Kitasatospora sp. NBC_00315 TaxID=2975963 RepID=UPI003253CDE1